MLKIIAERSDNGNKFLCLDCANGEVRSGTMGEMEVACMARGLPGEVTFRVTQCTKYHAMTPWNTAAGKRSIEVMKKQAWRISFSKAEPGQVELVDPAEWKRRVAADEEYDPS